MIMTAKVYGSNSNSESPFVVPCFWQLKTK